MKELLPAVEIALSKAWGAKVKVSLQEALANRRHVARLAVQSASAELPKTVILKGWRSEEDAGFDPNFFDTALLNEWASLEFMGQIFGKGALSPQVYAGDKERGFIVIEDLPEGSTIEKILNGDNLAQAKNALRTYGEVLGRLHAQTLGHLEAFYRLRKNFGFSDTWKAPKYLDHLQSALKTLEALNFEIPPNAYNETQEAARHLSQLDRFTVLHHGDPAPNNAWMDKTGRVYLFDFESATFDHAFLEGVTPRMGFPTWGMAFVNRIPEKCWREAEASYLKALSSRCPEAADASLYGSIITASCLSWTLDFCDNWLERVLGDALPLEPRNRVRQVAISRIEAFVQAAQEFNCFPVLGETFTKILEKLRSQWPLEAQELPLFPVFQNGNP
jgi:hypothetical protein